MSHFKGIIREMMNSVSRIGTESESGGCGCDFGGAKKKSTG